MEVLSLLLLVLAAAVVMAPFGVDGWRRPRATDDLERAISEAAARGL